MEIVKVKAEDISPAEYNPRKELKPTDKEYQAIKKSIEEFGYIDPILINADGTIIGGHQRFNVLKDLGYTEIEAIRVDIDKKQEKALNIALNKITGRWDNRKLDKLLKELGEKKYDLTLTGFKPNTSFQFGVGPNQRENTYKVYNLELYDESRVAGKYQMPIIEATDFIPDDLIGFNYMMTSQNKNAGIHCYVDDYQFERLWNRPDEYIDKLREYQCFLSPDFSLYMDMPYAMKVWNVYRNRMIGQYYQDNGIEVIPTLQWAEKETFDFCFDGIEEGGTVSVSTIGVKQDSRATQVWFEGMAEAIKRIKPKTVLVYGGDIGFDFGGTKALYFDNKVTERMKSYGEQRFSKRDKG